MLKTKLSLLLASAAVSVAHGGELTGYLMDKLCVRKCEGKGKEDNCYLPDGSHVYYTPQDHTGWCLLLPPCEQSGYMLVSKETYDDEGRHKIIADFTDDASQAAVVEYITNTTGNARVSFPLVTVVHPDDAVVVTSDAGDDVVQVTNAVIKDTWSEDAYTGAETTQTYCADVTAADIEANNMCFRSDVEVSKADAKGMYVIESNGCPDHSNMNMGTGLISNSQPDPTGGGYVVMAGVVVVVRMANAAAQPKAVVVDQEIPAAGPMEAAVAVAVAEAAKAVVAEAA
eukprot:CAMPEP_0183704044 /NCGR_PEP_ID=MMETSP0737-20130205/1529_1 /TAXON_ID=385413 /ORGANISM="Thalassiosira miniscula, Strain CCMP1093" /LENGTH=284 /DNA_ID=CAMNT_0025930855 /DNA_START=117 /DNA_END=968 /DNA_ORIENTATION=-